MTDNPTRFPLRPGVKYEDLSDGAKKILATIERAADDPLTQLMDRALQVWFDTLTLEDKQWLRSRTPRDVAALWRGESVVRAVEKRMKRMSNIALNL